MSNQGDENAWLVTWSDSITLLMAFFVVLLSISTIDQSKVESLQAGLDQDFLKTSRDLPFTEIEKKIAEIVQTKSLEDDVTVLNSPLGVTIEFSSHLLFESGQADIKSKMVPILTELVTAIKESSSINYLISIEGHTDNIPIRTNIFASNWELSALRATHVVRLLIQKGIPYTNVRAIAYADSRPMVPNVGDNGRPIRKNQAANRRVLMHIERQH
ncbi:MAG: chemotaxis protein MotB [Actinobacteria bacterium]|nr:chemotaxis protein MotB [Actinomycetota bacterium]